MNKIGLIAALVISVGCASAGGQGRYNHCGPYQYENSQGYCVSRYPRNHQTRVIYRTSQHRNRNSHVIESKQRNSSSQHRSHSQNHKDHR